MREREGTAQESFEKVRADYSAAKHTRFRRRRQGLSLSGSGADYHYRSEADYLRMMEYARDMDRNDAIVGQMVNRAVLNTIQNGLQPDPKTGDDKLDAALKERWWDWATDARQCSIDGEMVYADLEEQSFRAVLVDGDIFPIHTEEGALQLVEAHRCRTPSATKRNVVHGVLMDDNRKRLEYWFTRDDLDPMKALVKVSEIDARPAFDEAGNRLVLHLRDPKRVTQTRGVTAFAPIFDLLGMHEDLQFTKLVQQQVASCIAFLRERTADYKGGAAEPYGPGRVEVTGAYERLVHELAPGLELKGAIGETIKGFSPNIPNSEFFQQMRTILQQIGINLGLPLVLLLMDASDTNFSGWRGAMDQAKLGFKRNQRWFIDHFETPNYLWKLRDFAREDRALRTAMEATLASPGRGEINFFKHEWNAPRWPYIQPLQDAQAAQLRRQDLQTSPRRLHAELSQDWDDVVSETVEDNGAAIERAIDKARAITQSKGERVSWMQVLFLTHPDMIKASVAPAASVLAPSAPTPATTNHPTENDQTGSAGDGGNDPPDPEDMPAKEDA